MQSSTPSHRAWRCVPAAVLLAAFLLLPAAAHAALNDSGQTQCYDSSDNVATCNNNFSGDSAVLPRQDARFGRDAASQVAGALTKTADSVGDAGFDFTKISNSGDALPDTATLGSDPGDWGCTRDNVTGLMWEVKLDDSGSPRHKDATYTWGGDASGNGNCGSLSTCNTGTYIIEINSGPGLCGQTDWRLPNLRELASIVHYGKSVAPLIDTSAFPNTASGEHWSSEEATTTGASWYVSFDYGYIWNAANTSAKPVRLVSGTAMQATFQDNHDGTVTDTATGLMWMQCSQGQTLNLSGPSPACDGGVTSRRWDQALQQAATANAANALGYNDWRLPNLKELHSLVDVNQTSGAKIDPAFFPSTANDYYWSSTTFASHPSYAWYVNFHNGATGSNIKGGTNNRVRLVRGGQSFDLLIPATTALTQTGATATETTFSATLEPYPDNVGSLTGYWLVRLAADPAPTPDELRSGAPGVTSGSAATASGQAQTIAATGLTAGTDYVLYYAAEDADDNMNLIQKLEFIGGPMPVQTSSTAIPALGGAGLAALALMLAALVARSRRARQPLLP